MRPAMAGEGRYFVIVPDGAINPAEAMFAVDPNGDAYEVRPSAFGPADLPLPAEGCCA